MQSAPQSRYKPSYQHASYGLYKWFNGKGVFEQKYMQEIVSEFALANGFKGKEGQTKRNKSAMVNFSSNRFEKFTQFASKKIKDNPNYLIPFKIN